ncbi:MAG: ribosome maturation factor RimM [Treponema sp.]|nr:ribosome maturation factor RimM [Treponema sp.]
MTERFTAALVGGPFGLAGFVKVRSLSGETAHLRGLAEATLRFGGPGGREERFAIDETAPCAQGLLVRFRGIDSPEAARALTGAEIIVPRAQAAPLAEGEFYIEDLKGLRLHCNGETAAVIVDVVEGGGGSLIEAALPQGGTRFVPFRPEFIGDIDIEKGEAALLHRWILE